LHAVVVSKKTLFLSDKANIHAAVYMLSIKILMDAIHFFQSISVSEGGGFVQTQRTHLDLPLIIHLWHT